MTTNLVRKLLTAALAYMHAPAGRGCWAFRIETTGEVLFSPAMTYGEARRWVRARVRAGAARTLGVVAGR